MKNGGVIIKIFRRFTCVIVLMALTSVVCPVVRGDEFLTPIKLGKSGLFSYGLCSITTNASAAAEVQLGPDLLLALRNVGAKFISLTNVSAEDFELRDRQIKPVKLILREKLSGMAYGETTIAHLRFENRSGLDTKQPWSLRFKSKPKAFVEFDLLISKGEQKKSAN